MAQTRWRWLTFVGKGRIVNNHGRFGGGAIGGATAGEVQRVAGIITICKGHDAAYPWKQIGTENGSTNKPESGASSRAGLGYYLSPAERGGEPPGTWTGLDVAELGFEPGGIVRRDVFEPLYGQHADPRDQAGETTLGRAPGRYKTAEEIYARLIAAEPHAIAERREQLMVEAKAQVRTADLYWDATFSVSTSISLIHASALANAAAAVQRGDRAAATRWQQVADGIWDSITEGNAAALGYLQREVGQTRAGYHPGRAVGGRPAVGDRVVPAAHQQGRRPAAARAQPDLA